MEKIKAIKSALVALLFVVLGVAATGCSDDDPKVETVDQGVVFSFSRKLVYETSGVNEIGSVKVALKRASGEVIRQSMPLKGDEEMVKSEVMPLSVGDYKLIAYTAYSPRQEYMFDAELEYDNAFSIEEGQVAELNVPIKTREITNMNFLRNSLLGLCKEVFGDDQTLWPWDPNKYPFPDWEGLDFETDEYGNPIFLAGITFQGMINGKETPWAQMTEIPEGTISNLAEISSITICDIPAFKRLPEDLQRIVSLKQISCINTGLECLPKNVAELPNLEVLSFVNCALTEFPDDLRALKDLRVVVLNGNALTEFNAKLGGLRKFHTLDISNNPITSIGKEVFVGQTKMNSLVAVHTELSALPDALAGVEKLTSVVLDSNRLSAVPSSLKQLANLVELSLADNLLTEVDAADFEAMPKLRHLSLSGNKLGAMPQLNAPNMMWLEVENCGLKAAPAIAQYPELRVLKIGGNAFETLPANYFKSNVEMRHLSLSASPALKTLPEELGLVSDKGDVDEGFKHLEVEQCPNLRWTTPRAWKAYDYVGGGFKVEEQHSRSSEFITPDLFDEKHGCVGVKRAGSPYVELGK